mgnify:CR=1 FL=1
MVSSRGVYCKVWFSKDKALVVCHGLSSYGNAMARPMESKPEDPYHMINIKDRTLEQLMTFELKDT